MEQLALETLDFVTEGLGFLMKLVSLPSAVQLPALFLSLLLQL